MLNETRNDVRGLMVQSQERPPASARPRVAVVDDDPAVCNSLKFALELEGFVVRTYNGADALFDDPHFDACDCFVIDQRMPGMTGLELIAKLRDLKLRIPVILLISHPNPAVVTLAASANVPIVEKPLLGNALMDKIRAVCEAADHSQKNMT
jgi:two-component system, LuxR family, response regulator FixJ